MISSPTSAAMPMVLPVLLLVRDTQARAGDLKLESVPPDWCRLPPASLALLDTGDSVLVWMGPQCTERVQELIPLLADIAKQRAHQRRPSAAVSFITSGSPAERLVFSRLAPSVCISDWEQDEGHLIDEVTFQQHRAVLNLPHTDQSSFKKYTASILPMLLKPFRSGSSQVLNPTIPLPPIERIETTSTSISSTSDLAAVEML